MSLSVPVTPIKNLTINPGSGSGSDFGCGSGSRSSAVRSVKRKISPVDPDSCKRTKSTTTTPTKTQTKPDTPETAAEAAKIAETALSASLQEPFSWEPDQPYIAEDGAVVSIRSQVAAGATHTLLPKGYDLRDRKSIANRDPWAKLLKGIFPDHASGFVQPTNHSSLAVLVDKLPPKPWPLTVGGVPLLVQSYDKDEQKDSRLWLFPPANGGSMFHSICNDTDGRQGLTNLALKKLTVEIMAHFQALLKARVVHVLFTRGREFYVVLEVATDMTVTDGILPSSIAQCPTRILREDRFPKVPYWSDLQARARARRATVPKSSPGGTQKWIDRSAYDPVRPGVFVEATRLGHAHPEPIEFTSGVKVANAQGKAFMTTPAHCITPLSTGISMPYKETDGGQTEEDEDAEKVEEFGDIRQRLPGTDVTMVELREGVRFENTTFETDTASAIRLTSLVGEDEEIETHRQVMLDSPWCGRLEGTVEAQHVYPVDLRIPGRHGLDDMTDMIVYNWIYHGQDRGKVPQGTCGTPVVALDGKVMGVYFLWIKEELNNVDGWKGFSLAVSSSELFSAGYTLVQDPEEGET